MTVSGDEQKQEEQQLLGKWGNNIRKEGEEDTEAATVSVYLYTYCICVIYGHAVLTHLNNCRTLKLSFDLNILLQADFYWPYSMSMISPETTQIVRDWTYNRVEQLSTLEQSHSQSEKKIIIMHWLDNVSLEICLPACRTGVAVNCSKGSLIKKNILYSVYQFRQFNFYS